MPDKAIPGAGNTGRRSGTENVSPVTQHSSTNQTQPACSTIPVTSHSSDYHTIHRAAYEAVLDDALDTLATNAVRFARIAGRLADDPNVSAEHREAMQAISDAVASRLRERCMAYEAILRTTTVPETRPRQRRSNGRMRYGRAV